MLGVCDTCANELVEHAVVKCRGFCSACVCLKCSKMDNTISESVAGISNLYWMCDACGIIMENARFKNAMVSTNAVADQNFEALKNEIRCSVLDEIRHEIRTHFKKLIEIVPKTPTSVTPSLPIGRNRPSGFVRNKRLRENDGDEDIGARRPAKAMCGIGTGSTDTNLVATAPTANDHDKFWLYLSGILPDVPEEMVTELVQSKLGTTDLRVVKLVARGRDISTLSFVLYKIGMAHDLPREVSRG